MSSTPANFTWGINIHQSYSLSTEQQLELAKQIGLSSLRVDVYDASQATQTWLSSLVTEANSMGITIMPVIVPSAAAATSEASARAWGLSVGSTLATAFPTLTWEAGNELDQYAIKAGVTGQSTSDYDDTRYDLARGAIGGLVDGIHSADPTAKVVVGITGIDFGFLQRLSADGVKWDITSEHYYAAPGATDVMTGAQSLFSTLAQFQHPILLTEFNQQQGNNLSPGAQTATVEAMMDAMTTLAPQYGIIGAYLYELLDEPQLSPAEAHYGLASASGALNSTGTEIEHYLVASATPPHLPASLTEVLVSDTGPSVSDHVTSKAALTGVADANATLHFTADGAAVTATVTTSSSGGWSWTPGGLADGTHTVAISEANSTGSTSLTFALDTHAPVPTFTNEGSANGIVTLSGTTGSAGDTVSILDGSKSLGGTTTTSNGSWTFSAPAASNAIHTYQVSATDLAGNQGNGNEEVVLGSTGVDTLVGGAGGDVVFGNSGNDTLKGAGGADTLIGGAGKDTFSYSAASDSTPAAPDTISDFQHGSDKINLTAIAGINATGGIPQFQGKIGASGNGTVNAHSVAIMEAGRNTHVLVNTTSTPEKVTTTDTHASNMDIVLSGVHLGLTNTDFHHV